MIFKRTPPTMAQAQLAQWDREKEAALAKDIGKAIKKAHKRGLGHDGIVRVTRQAAGEMKRLLGE